MSYYFETIRKGHLSFIFEFFYLYYDQIVYKTKQKSVIFDFIYSLNSVELYNEISKEEEGKIKENLNRVFFNYLIVVLGFCNIEETTTDIEFLREHISKIGQDLVHLADSETVRSNLKLLAPKFVQLESSHLNKELLEFIYQNHLYNFSEENLNLLFLSYYDTSYPTNGELLTLALSKNDESLSTNIKDNIDEFLRFYIPKHDILSDNQESVIIVINEADDVLKHDYINKWRGRIERLQEVRGSIDYNTLAIEDKIEWNEFNILEYYSENNSNLDEILVQVDKVHIIV